MTFVKPFFRHAQHGRLGATVPVPERYTYHDHDGCPEGRKVKASGEWQYYQPTPGTRRAQCPVCARLAGRSVPGSA